MDQLNEIAVALNTIADELKGYVAQFNNPELTGPMDKDELATHLVNLIIDLNGQVIELRTFKV